MFVVNWGCISPSAEVPVSLKQVSVRSCLEKAYDKSCFKARAVSPVPNGHEEDVHSPSPLTHMCKAILRVELCSQDRAITIIFFMGFVLLCVNIAGLLLWIIKH